MNLLDLLIIYLACGAPFGVYYFLQKSPRPNSISFWLKLLFNFIFWLPLALFVAFRSRKSPMPRSLFVFGKTKTAETLQKQNLYSIQKQLETLALAGNQKISIYEFRETFERYVGLSLAVNSEEVSINEQEKEIFRAARSANLELGAICLRRRNRKRLFLHQKEARKDFLNLLNRLFESGCDENQLLFLSIELVKIFEDNEARKMIEKMFGGSPQTEYRLNVRKTEKDLWKPELQIPLPVRPISPHIQTMKATANLSEKD